MRFSLPEPRSDIAMNQILKKGSALLLAGQMLLAPLAASAESFSGGSSFSSPSSSRSYSGYSPFVHPSAQQPGSPSFGVPLDTYFTDNTGNILMYVNVLGEVQKPGFQVMRQDADLGNVLAMVGGPNDRANLKKVKVMRYRPEKGEPVVYTVDLKEYFKTGERSGFVQLKPNDTVVIPKDRGLKFGQVAQYTGLAVSVLTLFYLIDRNN